MKSQTLFTEGVPLPYDGPRRRSRPNFWTFSGIPGVFFLIIVFGIPLLMIVARSLTDPSPANYLAVIQDPVYRASLWRTIEIAAMVTVLTAIVGYPVAYVMARSGRLMSTFLLAVLMVSFWTSLLVRTFAWQAILNNTGIVNTFLLDLGVIQEPLPLARNLFAVFIGMVHILMPYAILATWASLRSIRPEVEQAAQSLGAHPLKVFLRITLPLSLPGVAAGAVLVFVLALGFYITPALLGGPQDSLISQSIVLQVQQYLHPGLASAMSVALVLLVMIVFFIATKFVGLGKILGVAGTMEESR